ncbi:hypothetical protein P4H83_18165 [Paenibacillus favisporus]|uniref:hypothetical protein n=1 Tax=Paenibacillus favisporus TaxID=221028 RepID=UPI002DB90AFA|nr:hypothetical protein [Paenibacillus favisporus]MEC0176803.1 hypothetical protein [Paenibacillus favisporus]
MRLLKVWGQQLPTTKILEQLEEQGKELAKMELQLLLTLYEFLQEQITELHARMNELLKEIPYSNQPFAMKGIGRDTAV